MGGPVGGKGKLILSIVVIAVLFALAGAGFYLLQNEKSKNMELAQDLEKLKAEQKLTASKLDESRNMISGLERKLQEAKSQVDKLTVDLEQEKAAKQQAEAQTDSLRQDLDAQKSLRSDLEKKLSKSQDDTRVLQDKLKDLDSKKTALENKLKELQAEKEKVELGKIVVTPESKAAAEQAHPKAAETKAAKPGAEVKVKDKNAKPAKAEGKARPEAETKASSATAQAAPAEKEGKVLVINRDYNFAVINLGNKDGVNADDIYSVYHNNKYIGDIKVMKVHESMSAADFMSADIKSKIAEDDKVVRKAK